MATRKNPKTAHPSTPKLTAEQVRLANDIRNEAMDVASFSQSEACRLAEEAYEKGETHRLFEQEADFIIELLCVRRDSLRNGRCLPFLRSDHLNTLRKLLSADTNFSFVAQDCLPNASDEECLELGVVGLLKDGPFVAPTGDTACQGRIVEIIRELVKSAAILAKSLDSSSLNDWAHAAVLLDRSPEDGVFLWTDEELAIDEVFTLLPRANTQLMADVFADKLPSFAPPKHRCASKSQAKAAKAAKGSAR